MKIGNVEISGRLVLGPMAGTTNEAFRIICKENGAALVYAEMVSTEGLTHQNKKTYGMIEVSKNEHPISLQIFGFDVNSFVKAAKIVNDYSDCDIIDINMGCPAPKVAIRSQAGSNLLKYPDRVGKIICEVVKNTNKPVTVKMRIGWDENNKNIVELAKIAERNGAAAIAIHARTRSQFYTGKADWEWIKKVKDVVNIPVIGNGDVIDGPSAQKMLSETGCDAVMIARAAQGNPWIFREIDYYLRTGQQHKKPTFEEWKNVVLRHAKLLADSKEENFAIREMRKQLLWYIAVLGKNKITLEMKKQATKMESLSDLEEIICYYKNNI